ncbi:hypothetical protein B0H10DRAFT_1953143 [Mycena sp. CBHHK59/15]|nr:hypothetical protein B0H10DRAFT_1953143 [Mycena sp. CBHHK59/15]
MLSSAFQFILISLYLTTYSGHQAKLDALLLRFPMQSSSSELLEFSFRWTTTHPSPSLRPLRSSACRLRPPSLNTGAQFYSTPLWRPGGSGVDAIVGAGAAFATIFGPEFDIVGFDPRGLFEAEAEPWMNKLFEVKLDQIDAKGT